VRECNSPKDKHLLKAGKRSAFRFSETGTECNSIFDFVFYGITRNLILMISGNNKSNSFT
jgi:hypothetical protein